MPIKPSQPTFTNVSARVLNAIRNSASTNYKEYVPIATDNADSLRAIGTVIRDYAQLKDEFMGILNTMCMQRIVTSRSFENPLQSLKKGTLEYGEYIEEIFIDIAKVFGFNTEDAEQTLLKRVKPNVKSAYHYLNYKTFYKVTIETANLYQAFNSWNEMDSFIQNIISSLVEGASYDEFQVMKYMLALQIINGRPYATQIPQISKENMEDIVTAIKMVSNEFEFRKSKYNVSGVRNLCKKANQVLLVNTEFDARMDVNVLASAFNMDKVQFSGRRIMIDGFGNLDNERLAEIFAENPNYVPLTTEQLTELDKIPCMLFDENYTQIYDHLTIMDDVKNAQGIYTNYFYHVHKTFSISPFANVCMFVPSIPTITSVALTPSTVNAVSNMDIMFRPTVLSQNFAPLTVDWAITGNTSDDTIINESGTLTIASDETASTITVTATSTFDGTKKGTATVTLLD